MRPLTPDDLLPLEDFAGQRREHFEAHVRYVDRYRRVRLGPRLTLVFENRQTLWFCVQEVLRVARLADPQRVREELAVYNRLLPGRGRLQAALLIDPSGDAQVWKTLLGQELRLRMGGAAVPAELVTCRPEDCAVGAAHWVCFTIDDNARRRLEDFRHAAHLEIVNPAYQHESGPLGDDVRQSLLDDLELSDRD
ncbi:MAG TPA: DUF3501 family protein [Gemmataceae bacterium]|nr:DUF3501 family protein [Gemmataceae bacterium]